MPAKPAYIPTEGAKVTRPFANCSMDLITNLPPVEGYDSILLVVDQGLSKGVILTPCNKTLTSEDTVRLLLENLYKRFGLPDKIISDRGPQFESKAFVELLKLLGIKSALSTAYHPQNRRHADRQHTPFELMFGESPVAIPLSYESTKYPTMEDQIKALLRNQEAALAAHELARSRMADRRKSMFVLFTKGDQVWLDSRNLKTRTIFHYQSTGTGYLQVATSGDLANP